jgi:peptidoglycan/xylan/chitin deacetylase (PgdA/CDA1 family)
MRLFRLPSIAGFLYPGALFRIKTTEKVLYLTFDDGPDPLSTPGLLGILKKHEIKSLFFCTGKWAECYPDLVANIKSDGHLIGNHGYNHMNGWNYPAAEYVSDIDAAARFTSDKLFRPPFGRIKKSQYNELQKRYKIFFWDLMSFDYDDSFGKENSLRILKKKIRAGSVIVFHDRSNTCANEIMEEFIEFAKSKGYRFELPFQD